MWRIMFASLMFGMVALAAVLWAAEQPLMPHEEARKLFDAGNYKDAYEALRARALAPAEDPAMPGQDLQLAVECLQRLGRADEIDDFREKVIAAHAADWRLLMAAAQSYTTGEHYGFMVAGKFQRGSHRGGGQQMNSLERDRIRAIQLMVRAEEQARAEKNASARADFYLRFAEMLLHGTDGRQAWRFQILSDLSALPDYEEGYRYGYGNAQTGGAPVNADGSPVFHRIPKSWQDAASDGQRWRWCLVQAVEADAARADEVRYTFATFLRGQFDVQTMGGYGSPYGRSRDDSRKDESGPYAVATLGEDETIARLATGIKRFKLPDEFNFIRLFQQIAEGKAPYAENALGMLAQIFSDRQEYPKAAEYWKQNIQRFGPGAQNQKQKALDQITGNWGQFESLMTQPAGEAAKVDFRFRNGKKVHFEAREIDVAKLLEGVKAYIRGKPNQLDYQTLNIGDIGYRLVQDKGDQYLGKQAAAWDLDLDPREKHFDRRITVATPLKSAGAYLLKATMDGGNTSQIVLWLADTIVVKKAVEQGSWCFVADAITGEPVANAKMGFFGYRQRYIRDRQYQIDILESTQQSDADGQVLYERKQPEPQGEYQWLITATTPQGRLAYLGFVGIWQGRYYEQQYNQTKTFVMTDRPVYRPNQTMKFKVWVGQAQYDQQGRSPFAGQTFTVEFHNPKGDKILEKRFQADEYGGFDGEFPLEKDATLGVYSIIVVGKGGGSFRVEEYKKPEFEVKIDAPAEPVMLGEKIAATITAKYYFGAPVTEAKVKYKILRSDHSATWYPTGRWDWLYEPGYWWFAYDYTWYPGWRDWGCMRPRGWWWGIGRQQPEVITDAEVPIGKDGTVKVEIDTELAKAIHGDTDHRYEITAEITDQSRRTITGTGQVLVARKPFKVYAWVDRGYYRAGDVVRADFTAQTLDSKPVQGKGELRLLKIAYDANAQPQETAVEKWALDTNTEGRAQQQLKAAQPGQYRLSYTVTDAKGHAIEGGYLFTVRGEGLAAQDFRFNDIELVPDQREYEAGKSVQLMVNANRPDSTVLLFVRPTNGIYLPPKVLHLRGKSTLEAVAVGTKDMPNFFVEATTISGGQVFNDTKEIVVPPAGRVLDVQVIPSAKQYKPGEKAKVQLKLTDSTGEPFVGSTVVSIYDKAVEYISGGSNVPEIKSFFWKWRRRHYPRFESSLRGSGNVVKPGEVAMGYIGAFGYWSPVGMKGGLGGGGGGSGGAMFARRSSGSAVGGMDSDPAMFGPPATAAPMAAMAKEARRDMDGFADKSELGANRLAEAGQQPQAPLVQPTVRSNFADTALWVAALTTDKNGAAEVELAMPENLTTWKARVWAMGRGTQVGEGSAEVVTTKNLLVRLQAPRFFVQKDEVVLSANIHNYLKTAKNVRAILEIDESQGARVDPTGSDALIDRSRSSKWPLTSIEVPASGEKRVDWRVKIVSPGQITVRMKALTDEESDAMEMTFPVYIHGMLKTESWAGAIRPQGSAAAITVTVPQERRVEDSRLEIRYSPSVASAMVDALPYLVEYPYGCTEQTLDRFVPTVITHKILLDMKLDLKDIQQKRTNLNAQEIGDAAARAAQWKHWKRNPVFDEAQVKDMVREGLDRLAGMQLTDGGWGWFSGYGERSYPHTTAVVVHGLQIARANGAAVSSDVLDRGVQWLKNYQTEQVKLLKNAPSKTEPWKAKADNIDAFVYMVLADADVQDADMRDFLFRDRTDLAVYAKAMYGLAMHQQKQADKLEMILQNISQYLVQDDENQTAYLKLPENNWWWCWFGSDIEANAYYLKLLSRTDPKGEPAARLAKYLINNRKNATYWNSTRDTAYAIEALADFIRASGESNPKMAVSILIDGKEAKQVAISAANLFTFDNTLVLTGQELSAGKHSIEFRKDGSGPLYFNVYLTNFTLEDPITKAGLEIKVNRKYYKLIPVDKTIKAEGSRGQAVDQKVEKYQRQELANLAKLKSGDLVEIELEIESKNDYEYIIFEDMKAAGFEPVDVRSGYNGNAMHAYMELRDERVCFFVRSLARGQHSVAYRLRAETPGLFSALPTKASAMYAPELKANSDEIRLGIQD